MKKRTVRQEEEDLQEVEEKQETEEVSIKKHIGRRRK